MQLLLILEEGRWNRTTSWTGRTQESACLFSIPQIQFPPGSPNLVLTQVYSTVGCVCEGCVCGECVCGGAVLSDEKGQGERLQDLLVFANDTGAQVKPQGTYIPLLGLDVPAREARDKHRDARGQLTLSCPCSKSWPLPTTTSH